METGQLNSNMFEENNIEANDILNYLTDEEKKALSSCDLCPRHCKINRLKGEKGFCNILLSYSIALIINHKGEEPILSNGKGICNVFFSHCSCQCIYCQNYKISDNKTEPKNLYNTMDKIVTKIMEVLKTSNNIVGFVSPTHQIPIMKAIIRELNKRGAFPKIVYNTGGYDNVEQLQALENTVNVYLPDYKYAIEDLGRKYSNCPSYPETAIKALKEMYRQKGSSILTDKDDCINSGLIVRHLILPNNIENSKKALDDIAWELSPNVCLSLMSQYNTPFTLKYDELNRKITAEEYYEIEDFAYSLGFHKGYLQDLSSVENVVPDFDNNTFINNK